MRISKYILAATLVAASSDAFAHVALATKLLPADTSQKITFSVGHGCNDSTEDTWKIRVDIPAGFMSVRALFSDFGKPTVIRTAGVVTAVEWTKADADKLAADDAYYELTIRARTPNAPFTKLQFTVTQTCVTASGTPTTPVVWTGTGGSTPGADLFLAPKRLNATGWNKLAIPAGTTVAVADLGTYLGDALIVWKGSAAFSANPHTMAQVQATQGVTVLEEDLVAGDEIWVRY